MILYALFMPYKAASKLYRAVAPGIMCVRCLLDTNKYNKDTNTVRLMHSNQADKLPLLDRLSNERQQHRIVTA